MLAADPSPRRDVAMAGAVLVVPLLVGVISLWGRRSFPTADGAIIAMQVRDIPSHLPMFGVYSRYGFHHPGPLMFFWLAPFSWVLGLRAFVVGPAVLHALCLTSAAWLFHRRGGRPLLVLGTLSLVLLERAMFADLLDTWNPWLALTPFAVAVLLAWSVWERDWWCLPALVVVASFAIQTHLGYAVLAGVLLLVAAGSVVRTWVRRDEDRPRALVLAAAVGLGAACWALPVVEQVTAPTGNLTLIVRAFRTPEAAVAPTGESMGEDRTPAGWSKAFDSITQTLGARVPWASGNEELEPFIGRVAPAPAWTLLPMLALFAAGTVAALRRRRHEALALQAITGALALASVVAVARVTGEPYPYITRWLWVVGLFCWVSPLWSLYDAWATGAVPDGGPDPASASTADRRGPRRAVAVVAGLATVAGLVTAVTAPRSDVARRTHSDAIDHTIDDVVGRLDPAKTVLVTYEGPGWSEELPGYVVELERRGFTAWSPDRDAFYVGEHRTPHGRRVDTNLIVALDSNFIRTRLDRGQQPVARWDPLTPAEREELDLARLRLAAEYDDSLNGRPVADPMPQATRDRMAELDRFGLPIAVFLEDAALGA